MSTVMHPIESTVSQARPAAAAKPAVARLNYLDTLRVILISLVIALHTAIAYGASGSWFYTDPASNELSGILLTLVTGSIQAFSLGLYFFIAGYFTPGSFDRKGILRFWKERLLRLGIPLVLYTWALNRIPNYIAAVAKQEETRSFWDYFTQTFLTSPDEGPTWFIFALLLFSAGYTLWRLAARAIPPERLAWAGRLAAPTKIQVLGLGLVVSLLMFVVGFVSPVNETMNVFGVFSLMTIFFVQYILFFIAGLLAYRNDWLACLDGKSLRFWGWLSLACIIMMPIMFALGMIFGDGELDAFLGGLHWQSAAFMLWVGVFSVAISMTLILWLRDRKQSRLMALAGPNTFGVYLIHPLILVPLTVVFSAVPLDPLLKYAIVLPVVIALCFLVTAALRRIPVVKEVL